MVLPVLLVAVQASGDLIAHYTFNDSGDRYADSSGNGYDGTGDGSGTTFTPSGVSGLGDAMNSTTAGRMLVNTAIPIGLDQYTISFWATSGTVWDNWVSFGNDDFFAQMSGFGNDIFLENAGGVSGYSGWGLVAGLAGGLNHIVIAADSSEGMADIYINGSWVDESAWTVSSAEEIDYLAIGGARNTTVRNISATIDDVQVYDTALSSSEVSSLYSNPGSVIPEPATLGLVVLAGALGLLRRRRKSKHALLPIVD